MPVSGIAGSSSRTISTLAKPSSRASTIALKRSRSTASAPPAGTAASRADVTISESSRASSSLSKPTQFSSATPRSELLHTRSASMSVWWAGPLEYGRRSYNRTRTPRRASCHAASHPARPPPITTTGSDRLEFLFFRLRSAAHLGRIVRLVGVAFERGHAAALRFYDDIVAADRARFGNDAVPRDEVALRVVGAAEERAALARLAFDHHAAVFGTDGARG